MNLSPTDLEQEPDAYALEQLTTLPSADVLRRQSIEGKIAQRIQQATDWELMASGEDGFKQVANRRGWLSGYENAKGLVGEEPLRKKLIIDSFVSDRTGASSEELATGIPQLNVAKALFKIDDPSDEAVYAGFDGFVKKQIQTRETKNKIYQLSTAAAIRGENWYETRQKAQKLAGADWLDYETAFNQGHSDVFSELGDQDIKDVNQLWKLAGTLDGKETENTAGGSYRDAILNYEMKTPAERDKIMAGIAMRAEAEGQDVDGAFNRMAQAFRSGAIGIASGLSSATGRTQADRIDELLSVGTVPADLAAIDPSNIAQALKTTDPKDPFGVGQYMGSPPKTRPLSDEEKKSLTAKAQEERGYARFVQDLQSAGVKAKRYKNDKTQGGWFFGGTLEDSMVDLAESVPSMLVTAIPYAGPAMMTLSYAEKERARLEHDFPDASEEVIRNQSMAVGAWQAGADIIQNKLFTAKVPRLNAAIMKLGKPGAVVMAGSRAAVTGVTETAQEVFQDSGEPIIQAIASALSSDIKGPNWGEWIDKEADALGDIFRVSMLMGIVGGAGSTISDYMDGSRLKETLKDKRLMALNGIPSENVAEISALAETNPAAAAQLLQSAQIATPPQERQKIAQEAVRREEVETANTTLRDAGFPELISQQDGSVIVQYNDGVTPDRSFDNPEAAKADMDAVVQSQQMEVGRVNRMLIEQLEGSYNRTVGQVEVKEEAANPRSLQDAIATGETTPDVGRQRARMYLRSAKDQMGVTDLSDDSQIDSVLGKLMIQGASRNEYADGLTRMVISIREGAQPTVVFEEAIEAVGKFMLQKGGVDQGKMISWIRDTEAFTKTQILAENFSDLQADLQFQELIEGWSKIGVAHATGRIQDSQLPQAIKDFFRAIKQIIADVLKLAIRVREFSDSGSMDPEFRYWLDVAAGFDTEGELANQRAEAESEVVKKIAGDQTFSIAANSDRIVSAINKLDGNPQAKAKVYAAMKVLLADADKRWSKNSINSEETQARFEQFRDIARLEAIARAMPPEIRGILTSQFRQVAQLKTAEGRQNYIVSLLPKVAQAVESNLQKNLRDQIKKLVKKGQPSTNEARNRKGNIGGEAHAVFVQAKEAIALKDTETKSALQQADEMAEALREQLENADSLTDDQLEELDGRIAAIELFGDYSNADSARLTEGLDLLKGVYSEGRKARLEVIKARRAVKEAYVQTFLKGLGIKGPLTDAERNAARQRAKSRLSKIDEAIMEAGLSGSQKIRRLAELTDDVDVRNAVEAFEIALLDAELSQKDMDDADNRALGQAMRGIFGVTTEYGVTKKLRELTQTSVSPVEKIEGAYEKTIMVPKDAVEALLSGQVDGLEIDGQTVILDSQDLAALAAAQEEFEAKSARSQGSSKTVNFTRIVSEGQRTTIGEMNQLEGLQLWLTMRQADQASKLEKLGYDSQTMEQLEKWLKPEVKALGLWMVDRIGQDAFTIDQLHRSEKGVGLRLVDQYFPVRNDVANADNTGLQLGQTQVVAGKSVSFIKERVKNNAPPAYVNAVAVFLANRAEANFWKSHVTALREWNGIVKDKRFSEAVKNKMGETYYNSLTNMMKRIEAGGSLNAAKLMGWERAIKKWTGTFALGTLGMRFSTFLINSTAALNVGLEIPAGDLLSGMADVIARPEAFKDAFNSPAIQRRLRDGGTPESQAANTKEVSIHPFISELTRYARAGIAPISWVDTGSQLLGAAVVWEKTRKDGLAAGLTETDAKLEADRKVERVMLRASQPTTRLAKSELELAQGERPLAALFLLFASEPRKAAAIMYLAAREIITGKGSYGKPMAAQQLFTAFVLQGGMAYLLRSAYEALVRPKDDEEDEFVERFTKRLNDPKRWAYSLGTEHLRSVPIAGELFNQAMGGIFDQPVFDNTKNPFNSTVKTGFKTVAKLTDDKPATIEQAIEGGIDILQALGSFVPVLGQAGNLGDFVEGLATSNLPDMLSDEDRIRRIKARYGAEKKRLTEELGPTGKNKDIQSKKYAALGDKLKSELLPLTPELRKKAIEEIDPPKELLKQAGF